MDTLIQSRPSTVSAEQSVVASRSFAETSLQFKQYQRFCSYAQHGLLTPRSVFLLELETQTSSTPGDLRYDQLDLKSQAVGDKAFQSVRGYVLRQDDPNLRDKFSLGWNMFFSVAIEKPYDTPRIIADRRKAEIEQLCLNTALFMVDPKRFNIRQDGQEGRIEDAIESNIAPTDISYVLVPKALEAIAKQAFKNSTIKVVAVSQEVLPRVPPYTKDKEIVVPAYHDAVKHLQLETKQEYFGHIVRLPYEI